MEHLMEMISALPPNSGAIIVYMAVVQAMAVTALGTLGLFRKMGLPRGAAFVLLSVAMMWLVCVPVGVVALLFVYDLVVNILGVPAPADALQQTGN